MLAISTVFFTSCEDDDVSTINFVSFEGYDLETIVVDVNGSATQDIAVYTSNKSGSDRTFNIVVDASSAAAGSYNVPSAVTIPGGSNEATFTVTLSDVDLGIGVNTLKLDFENADGFYYGESKEINYIQACTEVTATLAITFDTYGEETGWRITDALGETVASVAAYARNNAPVTESISLCAGRDYTLVFLDSYGDGMAGSYTLSVGGVVKVSGPGAGFTTTESNAFDTK